MDEQINTNTFNSFAMSVDEFVQIADELMKELEELCPLCGSTIEQTGRCKTCPECGWSSCSYG